MLLGFEDPDVLSPVERLRFESVLSDFLHAYQVLFARVDEGILYKEVWDNLLHSLGPTVQQPSVAAFWEKQKPEFRSDFVAAVDMFVADAAVDAVETQKIPQP
ncbi:MAG TPA: hypothetical protein VLA33_09080 [Gemmatimonadota bacterium]|nr:hypothetical protein [Gemmatimonadota bacterium]